MWQPTSSALVRIGILVLLAPLAVLGAPAAQADHPLVVEQRLLTDLPVTGAQLGTLVALDGDRAAVLERERRSTGPRVTVFARAGGDWGIEHSLDLGQLRVDALDLDGTDLVIAGVRGSTTSEVVVHDLTAADPATARAVVAGAVVPRAGAVSVAMDSGRLVVGSNSGQESQAQVGVFARAGAAWARVASVTSAPYDPDFGTVVAVSGLDVVTGVSDGARAYRLAGATLAPAGDLADSGTSGRRAVQVSGATAVVTRTGGDGPTTVAISSRTGTTWQPPQVVTVAQGVDAVALDGTELFLVDGAGTLRRYAGSSGTWTAGTTHPLLDDDVLEWTHPLLQAPRTPPAAPSVDASAGRVLVGVPAADPFGALDAGQALLLGPGPAPLAPAAPSVTAQPGTTSGTVEVRWTATSQQASSHVVHVDTRWAEGVRSSGPQSGDRWLRVPASQTSVTLTGLTPYAEYRFSVFSERAGLAASATASTGFVVVPGPQVPVPSPYVLEDGPDPGLDPTNDIDDVVVDYTAGQVTVAVRMLSAPSDIRDSLLTRYRYMFVNFHPPARNEAGNSLIILDEGHNDLASLPGEHVVARFEYDDHCDRRVFPVRLVGGAYTVTFPAVCLGNPPLLRLDVQTLPDSSDRTAITPPVSPAPPPGGGSSGAGGVGGGGAGGGVATPVTPGGATASRLSGPDRYATAAAAALAWPEPRSTVFVATGTGFADALSGGAAAARVDGGPVLLVTRDAVPRATRTALQQLRPARVVVLGGTAAVGASVLGELASLTGVPVVRWAGADRYATAAEVSRRTAAPGQPVFVTSGQDFPDALATAAAAGHRGASVLLVRRDSLPEATRAELARLAPTEVVLVGGSAAVSDEVLALLRRSTAGQVTRVAGADRVATAVQLSAVTFAAAERVYVVTGGSFADALTAGALAGRRGAPVLLLPTAGGPPSSVLAEVRRLTPRDVVAVGGQAVVPDQVLAALTGNGG